MFLFIFESIGTSELMLVGIVALIFLGPRKLPEMARKMGKIMAEFRGTANEFKETWQREVNFEEEIKAFDVKDLEDEPKTRVETITIETPAAPELPVIKSVDPAAFQNLNLPSKPEPAVKPVESDKKNWL